MKSMPLTVAAALVAAAFSTAALAQDKPTAPANSPHAGQRIQSPNEGNVQGEHPSTENMDSNAQRQHSRSTPAASQSSKQGGNAQRAQTAQVGEVRDWNAIDTNKDHLISPEEMEADLAKGKKATQ